MSEKLDAATVIAKLEMARQQKGVRRDALAKQTGYSGGTLANMVKRPGSAKLSLITDVAEALGVQVIVEVKPI